MIGLLYMGKLLLNEKSCSGFPKRWIAYVSVAIWTTTALAAPPYAGTLFLNQGIMVATDKSSFQDIVTTGQGVRTMFDRRTDSFNRVNAWLFEARFQDGLSCEIQVNPEFSSTQAEQEATTYAMVIGKLPKVLRKDVRTVWIHDGIQPFGGGNNNLLIHTGQAAKYIADGILEETLVHEAAHTSLDAAHATSAGWRTAQTADAEFISTYAKDYPDREDIAESFLMWLAARHFPTRITSEQLATIQKTIPNRLKYFDQQAFELTPAISSVSPLIANADCLFNWAEKQYHAMLSPAGAKSGTLSDYYYRYYSDTNAYLAIKSSDNHLYFMGPNTGNAITDLGAVSTWLTQAGCK